MSGDTSQDAEGRTPEPEGTPEARYRVVGYVLYDPEAGAYIGRDGRVRYLAPYPVSSLSELLEEARRIGRHCLGVHALALMPVQVLPDVTLTEEVV